MSDLLVAPLFMKGVLSSAITMPGALSVMIFGIHLMLMLCVDNLAIRTKVRICRYVSYCDIPNTKFTTGATARSSAFFGLGVGLIYLDNVGCLGTESRLIDCPHNAIGSHDCSHSEDAGVTCLAPGTSTVYDCQANKLVQFLINDRSYALP